MNANAMTLSFDEITLKMKEAGAVILRDELDASYAALRPPCSALCVLPLRHLRQQRLYPINAEFMEMIGEPIYLHRAE
jgi:hypothetical protein